MKHLFQAGDLVKTTTRYDRNGQMVQDSLGIVLSQHVWKDSEDPEDRYYIVLITGKQYDIWEYGLEKVNAK
jgi:hypothetical protein